MQCRHDNTGYPNMAIGWWIQTAIANHISIFVQLLLGSMKCRARQHCSWSTYLTWLLLGQYRSHCHHAPQFRCALIQSPRRVHTTGGVLPSPWQPIPPLCRGGKLTKTINHYARSTRPMNAQLSRSGKFARSSATVRGDLINLKAYF